MNDDDGAASEESIGVPGTGESVGSPPDDVALEDERNVYGDELAPCGTNPETGVLRDGDCHALPDRDPGRHEVCAVMTDRFLEFTDVMGNDLRTPRPQLGFPGLEPGDRWCICLSRWIEAMEGRAAPPVVLDATNEAVLDEVDLDTLEAHAHQDDERADADTVTDSS